VREGSSAVELDGALKAVESPGRGSEGSVVYPSARPTRVPAVIRLYFVGHRNLIRLRNLLGALFDGFWLGVLGRQQLHAISETVFDKKGMYWTDEYNRQGLYDWERRMLESHFAECRKVLVAAAGGGRELLALRRQGMQADGFDCHLGLVRSANELLESEGMVPDVLRVTAGIGNALAPLLGRDRVEVGDSLIPNYAHYFTREELQAEMKEGGFELTFCDTRDYGHGVGVAV
jgi:hypothetical protein